MALLLPNLDDKTFAQIAEESRLLIPSKAPSWTDHNVHDPGITFIELFAWLAEIEHYRLNQTSSASYARFFSLMGITPFAPQAAEVVLRFNSPTRGLLIPAKTKVSAVGNETVPFQTVHDRYLTPAKLKRVVTRTGGREIVQTTAETNEVGHYEAFGPSPVVDDSLQLEFENWFEEPQGQLEISLFESDLPPRAPFNAGMKGFESSAKVRWEYRKDPSSDSRSQWAMLDVIHDGTSNLSSSGELIFRRPAESGAKKHKTIRAVLAQGHYEIPPRIVSIRTNTIRARQVERIVNEIIGNGLGTADQLVRLKNAPLFINPQVDDGPFQIGELLDWEDLIDRLNAPEKSPHKETIEQLLKELDTNAQDFIKARRPPPNQNRISDDDKYMLAEAFTKLLDKSEFNKQGKFLSGNITDEFRQADKNTACKKPSEVRRFNRFLLQRLFPDLLVGDRLELQTNGADETGKTGPTAWRSWEQVDDFLQSGPADRHYVLDAADGTILFGNGLNGKVPNTSELIRARSYSYSQMGRGNLAAGHQWALALPFGSPPVSGTNLTAATGGKSAETLDETKLRSREVFHKETAILTAEDFERLALKTPGLRVARVKIIANFNPKLEKLKLPGEITIIVVPQPPPRKAFPNAPPPVPGEGFLKTVRRHLEGRRLVTTNLHVIGPRYVTVKVSCRVFLKKRAAVTEVVESIKRALNEFFDPVFGGPETGVRWPFGRSVFPSEVSQQITKIAGVDYVTDVALNDQKVGASLSFPYNGLPTSSAHAITPVPFEDRGQGTEPRKSGDNCD